MCFSALPKEIKRYAAATRLPIGSIKRHENKNRCQHTTPRSPACSTSTEYILSFRATAVWRADRVEGENPVWH